MKKHWQYWLQKLSSGGVQPKSKSRCRACLVLESLEERTLLTGPATHFAIVGYPNPVQAGTAFNLTVEALDSSNNVDTGYDGTVHIASTDNNAVLPANFTLTAGVGIFSVTLETDGSQNFNVTGPTYDSGPNLVEAPGSPFGVAYATTTLAGGDFNGDGLMDLVGASSFYSGGPITVYMNNGDGTFTAGNSFNVGYNPNVVVVGDFNGDGKMDLAFPGGNTVGVVLGNGNGTFGPVASYQVGNGPGALVAGDFTGDGKQDLAVLNDQDRTLSILIANPNGTFGSTFEPATTIPVGNGPTAVAVGDFNNDGKLDLVVTNTSDNDVEVFLGNGNGTFKPGVTSAAGAAPSQIAVADFNGDGNMDLVVNNPGSNALTVLLGNGNGTFGRPTSYTAGPDPGPPAAVDLNGDGKPDLVYANVGSTNLNVLLGNGNGTFAAAPSISASTYGASSLLIGNLNGDGTPDIACLDARWNAFALLNEPLTGTSNVSVNPAAATHFGLKTPQGASPGHATTVTVTALDQFNNTATGYGGTVHFSSSDSAAVLPANSVLINGVGFFGVTLNTTGNQTLTVADTVTSSITGTSSAIGVGGLAATHFAILGLPTPVPIGTAFRFTVEALDSFNNPTYSYNGSLYFTSSDSRAVLPAGGSLTAGLGTFSATLETLGSQSLTIYGSNLSNSPNLVPGPGPIIRLNYASGLVAGGNFANNGDFDVVGTSGYYGDLTVYLNAGNGSFTQGQVIGSFGAGAVAVGDFNGDGNLDLAGGWGGITGSDGDTVVVLLGNGNGTFGPPSSYLVGNSPGPIVAGDFTGDGRDGLAVINTGSDTLSILLANPNGAFGTSFLPATTLPLGNGPNAIVVGDLNNDGKLDIIVTNTTDNDVEIFQGNGNGTFEPGVTYYAGPAPSQAVLGDFTGNGKLDIAVNNPAADTISVLMNKGNGTFGSPISFAAGVSVHGPI